MTFRSRRVPCASARLRLPFDGLHARDVRMFENGTPYAEDSRPCSGERTSPCGMKRGLIPRGSLWGRINPRLQDPAGAETSALVNGTRRIFSYGRSVAVGIGRDLQSSVQRQFLEDVVDVALDCVRRNVKAPRDFFVTQAFFNEADDFPFTSGHPNRSNRLASCDGSPGDL